MSEALRKVRSGKRLVVLDRDIPVAEVIPYGSDETPGIIPPSRKFSIPKNPFSVSVDPLDFLLEERNKR